MPFIIVPCLLNWYSCPKCTVNCFFCNSSIFYLLCTISHVATHVVKFGVFGAVTLFETPRVDDHWCAPLKLSWQSHSCYLKVCLLEPKLPSHDRSHYFSQVTDRHSYCISVSTQFSSKVRWLDGIQNGIAR